jgi:hypothetical protein
VPLEVEADPPAAPAASAPSPAAPRDRVSSNDERPGTTPQRRKDVPLTLQPWLSAAACQDRRGLHAPRKARGPSAFLTRPTNPREEGGAGGTRSARRGRPWTACNLRPHGGDDDDRGTPAGWRPTPSFHGPASDHSAATPTPQGRPVITIMHHAIWVHRRLLVLSIDGGRGFDSSTNQTLFTSMKTDHFQSVTNDDHPPTSR